MSEKKATDRIKLFCLPYVGGSSISFSGWKKFLDEKIDLKPVELAGRRSRRNDPLYSNMEEAVNDIYEMIAPEANNSVYAMFGHSMGVLLVYELLRKMKNKSDTMPVHVFFSGRFPPFMKKKCTKLYTLPDDAFIAGISRLGGFAGELLQNKEVLNFFLPVLRSDYKLIESYIHKRDMLMLDCDISVLSGRHDTVVNRKDLDRYQDCTSKSCMIYEFNGGHFFINTFAEAVVGIVNKTLTRIIR